MFAGTGCFHCGGSHYSGDCGRQLEDEEREEALRLMYEDEELFAADPDEYDDEDDDDYLDDDEGDLFDDDEDALEEDEY